MGGAMSGGQGVQPHYVAAPIIQGGPDPIPRRFGWLKGHEDCVVLPELKAEHPRQRSFIPPGALGSASSSRGPYPGGGGDVEDALAQLGDGEGLYGFHEPLRIATMRYARQC
jgi:hypothetical protein